MRLVIISLLLMSGLRLPNAYAYSVVGAKCKEMPKGSCQRKMCRCFKGVHRVNKGKPIKRKFNKKGKPTIQFACAQNANMGAQAAWSAFLKSKPKLSKKCGGPAF